MGPWVHIVALFATSLCLVTARVISQPTQCLGRATLRIHYDDARAECRSTLLVIGVGTAMEVNDYDHLAMSMATQIPNAVVVIVNHVRSFIKLNPVTLNAQPFATATNRITANLLQSSSILLNTSRLFRGRFKSFLPSNVQFCTRNSLTPLRILVGGHSASGGAAFYALDQGLYDFDVAGYVALDPFPIRSNAIVANGTIPTLAWGFTETTCQVTVSQSALAAYHYGPTGRSVLYQVQNSLEDSCHLSHCLFADRGCLACRNTCNETIQQDALDDVGLSVQLFVKALQAGANPTAPFAPFDTTNMRLDRSLYRIFPFNATVTARGSIRKNGRTAVSRTVETIQV